VKYSVSPYIRAPIIASMNTVPIASRIFDGGLSNVLSRYTITLIIHADPVYLSNGLQVNLKVVNFLTRRIVIKVPVIVKIRDKIAIIIVISIMSMPTF